METLLTYFAEHVIISLCMGDFVNPISTCKLCSECETNMSENRVKQNGADMHAAKASARKYSAGGYRTLAVIAFVLAVGGLFLGLLSKLAGFFAHSSLFSANGGALDGSLMGFLIAYVKTIFTGEGGFTTYLKGIYQTFSVVDLSLLLSSVVLAVGVVLSLVLGILSFVTKKGARKCAMTSAVFVFLGYAGFFLTNFYSMSVSAGFSRACFDVPTLIVAGVMLALLAIAGIARRKGLGLLNLVFMVLTLVGIYALCNQNSFFAALSVYRENGQMTANLFFSITAIALFVLTAFNFVVSTVRLSAKKAYIFDAVRYGLWLIVAFLTIWAGNWTIFTDQLLAGILLLIAPFAALALSVLTGVMQIRKGGKKTAAKANPLAAAIAPAAKPAPAPAEAVAHSEAAPVQHEAAAAAAQPADDGVTVNFPQTAEPVKPQNVTVNVHPAMYGQQPVMMPVYAMPYYPGQPSAEQKTDEPMSEFERSMAALAKGIEPEQPQENAAAAPYQMPIPAGANDASAQPQPEVSYEGMKSTYDPFISGLTSEEKNNFGDMFIANKYGDLNYMPAYVIGGDNSEFFSKVFIYYGRFRSHISPSLLDKLYVYINRN